MFDAELDSAAQAARLALAVTQQLRQSPALASACKDDHSPVSAADLAAQALILDLLRSRHSGDAVQAEEDTAPLADPNLLRWTLDLLCGATDQDWGEDRLRHTLMWRGTSAAKRTWYVDPLDGTKGYLAGLCYAVAVGLVVDQRPQVAVLAVPGLPNETDPGGSPTSPRLFLATQGGGAQERGLQGCGSRSLRTGPPTSPLRAVGSRAHREPGVVEAVLDELGDTDFRAVDSQVKYALVARGDADLYLRLPGGDYVEKGWDHCAGCLLVEEAGGRVTDARGNSLRFSGPRLSDHRGIVATADPGVHERVLALLARSRTG